ncbi:MAG: DNA-deoxyinosine glycosylase [Micavibrio aeruginosavorus]|uniref:DNA-deoxyinosine glycosylase n=1 Tax=Micavibrio aeruginosavorus TaxID=349221 RepID=A0A7T5UGY2_9BACT|nr:MAG: DNA-deoxyinosine glycosylase [Micavibrio aeruginosavorus]
MSSARIHSFPPVVRTDARILVLGSMPGQASLRAGEYYAHPRNQFWPIMEILLGAGPNRPYQKRLDILQENGIALWDVLHSCARAGSLDSDIRDERPNDIAGMLAAAPAITRVYFNGAKAEAAFHRHVYVGCRPLSCFRLPSTSPAHAGMSFDEKLKRWSVITITGS